MPTVAAILEFLEAFAPPQLAADWDNVGLLLGERAVPVERVVTCLTVTPEVVAEAVAEQVQFIVTHHPILFRAVKRLTDATPEGRMLLSLIRHGVAVYSPHTAFDNTRDGINEMLAAKLGLTNALIIAGPEIDGNFKLAARNIPAVDVLPNAGLNVYDVLRRDTLVLTRAAVEAIEARFAEKEAA